MKVNEIVDPDAIEEQWHVKPINDLREHVSKPSCWCRPRENEPGVWIHNALDGREDYEQGRKLQ